MIKKLFFVFAGIACAVAQAAAQAPLSLSQCIDSALQNSLQIKSDNYDLDKTKASIGQAYSTLLPSVNGSGSYQYQFKVPAQVIPAEAFGGQPGTYQTLQFSVPQSKSLTVDASQTLFNASSLIALKAAKVAVNRNLLQIQSSREDLVYNVSATYYNIQTIMKQIDLYRNNLGNTDTLLASTTDQFNAGLATQTDVDRLTVSRDNTKASLENSLNNLEKQYNLLKLLMNVPMDHQLSVQREEYENTSFNLDAPLFDPEKKTNYLQIMENKRIADLERRNIKAGYLPTLSLSGSLGYSGYYSNANPFKNLNDKWYPSSSISLKLSVPIFDGFSKKYQVKQKAIEIRQYDVKAEQTKQQNMKDVANAYADLKSNFLTLQTQKRNLALAQKVLDDVNVQYKSGISKVTDVLNSQSELYSAQNNYINALINIKQAELDLKKAQGLLLNQTH
ncbi:MAG TPA: TolC family protein [Chitinophaga sp.]|nr:TolC family protein [Chitinophaga sp.]